VIELRIDVAYERIAFGLGRIIFLRAKTVHPLIAEQDQKLVLARRKSLLHLLEGNNGQIVKGISINILLVGRKAANLMITVALEKTECDIRSASGAEEDDLAHGSRRLAARSWLA
jgi:hypothetical protein